MRSPSHLTSHLFNSEIQLASSRQLILRRSTRTSAGSRSCSLTLIVCQGSLGEGRLGEGCGLGELLQDLFQVLGNLSKRSSGAGFHLMDKDGQLRSGLTKAVSFLHYLPRLRRQLIGRGQGRLTLTLQQWMARSRKGSGQSFPTRVRKAGTSRPKSCGDRGGAARLACRLSWAHCEDQAPRSPPWLGPPQWRLRHLGSG